MTTIAELLEQTPDEVVTGLEFLVGNSYNYIPEIITSRLHQVMADPQFAPKVETVIFYQHKLSSDSGQILFAVRYDGRWVMLCSNAGRVLEDYADRKIISAEAYLEMVDYIEDELIERISPDEIQETPLTTEVNFVFYGFDCRLNYNIPTA